MAHKARLLFRRDAPHSFQAGAVLILMIFILGLAAAAFILKSLTVANLQADKADQSYRALKDAKMSLIAWSVAHPNWPGIMPFPDRKETTNPNYDGKSDCVTNGLSTAHLLGKLPLSGDAPCITPQQGLSAELIDADNERLWYAVSLNLIRTNGNDSKPVIHSGSVNTPDYPWLRVLDRNGNLVSDRVAVVIIAPGAPLPGQNRTSSAPDPREYLDSFKIGDKIYSNADYDTHDEDFVMGEDSRRLSDVETMISRPYYFNDKLTYITIDELMYGLEKRALLEAKQQLREYYASSSTLSDGRFYPYAAALGDTQNLCQQGRLSGFLPIQPPSATCSSSQSCSLNFATTSVTFNSDTPQPYATNTGACSRSDTSCTCTGAGACSRASPPAKTFTCTTNGVCTSSGANPAGSFTFSYTPKVPDVTDVSGACSGGNGTVICNAAGDFSSPRSSCTHPKQGLGNLPKWFTANLWQQDIYYAISGACTSALTGCIGAGLSVGGRNQVDAAVIATGRELPATVARQALQVRHSSNILDYLDSMENTNNDVVYDAEGTPRNATYNDQVMIVAP